MRRGLLLFALLVIAAFAAGPAFGSAIIGREVSHATLAIDRHGHLGSEPGSDGRARANSLASS